MKRPYEFSMLISGSHYDEEKGWVDTPIEVREEALEKFRKFLSKGTRAGSNNSRAISRMSLSNLPNNYGIFQRLYINDRSGEVCYTAGQDYPSEIRTLRELIAKHC